VDDDKLVLRAINNFLSFEGHSVTSVDTGEEALRQIKDKEYDLLIIDVRMPGLNGIDTIKTIREYLKKQKKPAIPEIVITGYMDSAAENDAGKLGIKEFIYKPFSIKDFKSVIDKKITKVSNKKVS
jgi:CheY-like chemotaxis protein